MKQDVIPQYATYAYLDMKAWNMAYHETEMQGQKIECEMAAIGQPEGVVYR